LILRPPKGHQQQPDALKLPLGVNEAQSVLRVGLFTPYKNRRVDWYSDFYYECDDPQWGGEFHAEKQESARGYMCGLEIPLSELVEDNAVSNISARIIDFKDQLLAVAAKHGAK
jgi:hypothetical protein